MTKVPTEREVSLGLIKSFLDRADIRPNLYRSSFLTTPAATIAQISATPQYTSDERVREVATECQKAIFDTPGPWDDLEICFQIEKRYGWPRGTIHAFVYGTPHKVAA